MLVLAKKDTYSRDGRPGMKWIPAGGILFPDVTYVRLANLPSFYSEVHAESSPGVDFGGREPRERTNERTSALMTMMPRCQR